MDRKEGYLYATIAYGAWGFFPIYWKFLQYIPSLEILCHRVIWAFIFYTVVMLFRHRKLLFFWPKEKKLLINLLIASALIMFNWFIYIYAVNSNQIVETSLGYFINPLVNISLGVLLLKERLSMGQKIACASAAVGVLFIALQQARLPWIALALAFSFAFYGLIKKTNPVQGLKSNQFESLMMMPAAFAILIYLDDFVGVRAFPLAQGFDWQTMLLLIGAGPATGLPLVFFAEAAQRLPMYMLGFFQFMAPSIQFLSGVLIFNEPLAPLQLVGFVFIWLASIIIVFNNWRYAKQEPL